MNQKSRFVSPHAAIDQGECIIPDDAVIEEGCIFGFRVTLAGAGIVIRAGARLDAACVIGEGVTIGKVHGFARCGRTAFRAAKLHRRRQSGASRRLFEWR